MLQNILSNLTHRPATRRFPAVVREPFPDVRGAVAFDMTDCNYCGACALKCPSGAIAVNRAESTVHFDISRCILCACCEEACKKDAVHLRAAYATPVYRKPGPILQQAAAAPATGD